MRYVLDLRAPHLMEIFNTLSTDEKSGQEFAEFNNKVKALVKYLKSYDYSARQLSFVFFQLVDSDTQNVLKNVKLTVVNSGAVKEDYFSLITSSDDEIIVLHSRLGG